MSLDFNFRSMVARLGEEEYDRITDHPVRKGDWHPVTHALIWACYSVGLPGITEKNVDKFIERFTALQALSGGEMMSSEGRFYVTGEDIRNHIGLSTNVSMKSDAAFAKMLVRIAVDNGSRSIRLQDESAYDICNRRVKEASKD